MTLLVYIGVSVKKNSLIKKTYYIIVSTTITNSILYDAPSIVIISPYGSILINGTIIGRVGIEWTPVSRNFKFVLLVFI